MNLFVYGTLKDLEFYPVASQPFPRQAGKSNYPGLYNCHF